VSSAPTVIPERGSVLALDHSRAATGVALGSFELGNARALDVLRQADEHARVEALARLVVEWAPTVLVLGLPLARDGGEQAQSRRVRRFAQRLAQRFGLPVVLHDERWSTAAAEAALREEGGSNRDLVRNGDAAAAREILQGFLDARLCCRSDDPAATRTGP
jgi:putative Holliday junction resolvase